MEVFHSAAADCGRLDHFKQAPTTVHNKGWILSTECVKYIDKT